MTSAAIHTPGFLVRSNQPLPLPSVGFSGAHLSAVVLHLGDYYFTDAAVFACVAEGEAAEILYSGSVARSNTRHLRSLQICKPLLEGQGNVADQLRAAWVHMLDQDAAVETAKRAEGETK